MRASKLLVLTKVLCVALLTYSASSFAADPTLGRPATEAEIAAWNIDVFPDGKGLPPGKGSVAQGQQIYDAQCASCHGPQLEGGNMAPALAGGMGTLTTSHPIKTVGSYWPYTTTLFEYIRRAMPFEIPKSLSNDDVYSLSAYILYKNGLLKFADTVDAKTLASLKMPNRDGFIVDNRPDVKRRRCMNNCAVPRR